jgi:hypothetical protein
MELLVRQEVLEPLGHLELQVALVRLVQVGQAVVQALRVHVAPQEHLVHAVPLELLVALVLLVKMLS